VDDLLSEKEQLEQFRSWWKEYGAFVIGGIVIGAGILFGINYYQSSKLQAQLEASNAYESLVGHVVDGDLEEAQAVADEIRSAYGNTAYAGQSGLAMARLYMDKNRDQDAADALRAVLDGKADDELKSVARLRLARIYMYQDKPEEVVELLSGEENAAFAASYGEVLGDAYTALGRTAEAQDAYQKVLMDPLSQGTLDQQLVQWKALDLPPVETIADVASDEPQDEIAVEADEPVVEETE
jgi:predicted negative regulator of RcsB-dependent stress response